VQVTVMSSRAEHPPSGWKAENEKLVRVVPYDPGLRAKPTVDVIAGVSSLEESRGGGGHTC
jgi:hypothetical protein